LCAKERIPVEASYLLAANGIDLVVHVAMIDERAIGGRLHRFVAQVLEVAGIGEGGRPATNELFSPGPDGRAVPSAYGPSDRMLAALERAGFDSAYLSRPAGMWTEPLPTRAGAR